MGRNVQCAYAIESADFFAHFGLRLNLCAKSAQHDQE